jgi:hypothetical protein
MGITGVELSSILNEAVSTRGFLLESKALARGGRAVKWFNLELTQYQRDWIELRLKKQYPGASVRVVNGGRFDGLRISIVYPRVKEEAVC